MKNQFSYLAIFLMLTSSVSFASIGALFKVTTTPSTLTISTTPPNHVYPRAGIKILTGGYSLAGVGTACTMTSSGYCLFSVSSTTPKTITLSGSGSELGMILCLNGTGGVSCQAFELNMPTAKTNAYVVNNISSTVSSCTINSDGTLSGCNLTGSGFNLPYGITVNSIATMAYVANGGSNTIAVCAINSINKNLTCSDYSQSSTFNLPIGIAINSSNAFLYVTNFADDTVKVCTILNNGNINSCVDTGFALGGGLGLEGIAVAPSSTYAYVVANSTAVVYKCSINPVTGTFNSCVDSGATGIIFPELISLNSTGTQAFIANGSIGSVVKCDVNQTTGNLSACATVGSFTAPKQVALNNLGTKAYVTDSTTNIVSLCNVDNNGALSGCINSGGTGFNSPWGISLI